MPRQVWETLLYQLVRIEPSDVLSSQFTVNAVDWLSVGAANRESPLCF